ncbi:acyl-CoA dehydrogenase family protein [Nakamurella sp. GG22]
MPRRDFETDEANYLKDVEKYCDTILLARGDQSDDGKFFPEVIKQFADLGLLELMFDEDRNLELHRMRLVHETTELVAAAFPASVVALGALRLQAYLLKRYAEREIADRYLEPLLSGDLYGSFGVTEPDAGTDIRAITTVATRDGDGWILNGGKKWIGMAPYAAFNVVLAKLDHDGRDAETVALVIDLESEGITRSAPLDLMSIRGMPLGELTFNNVKVPAGSALKVAGFKGMLEGINLARVDAASYGCGVIKAAIRESCVRANTRTAFGQPLSNVQIIQHKIGTMATDYEAARLLTLAAGDSFALGNGGDPILLSKAKIFSTDAAQRHSVEAVQIFGALGVHHDSRVQRLFRDSKAFQIFDGTSEIHNLMIGRAALKAYA